MAYRHGYIKWLLAVMQNRLVFEQLKRYFRNNEYEHECIKQSQAYVIPQASQGEIHSRSTSKSRQASVVVHSRFQN